MKTKFDDFMNPDVSVKKKTPKPLENLTDKDFFNFREIRCSIFNEFNRNIIQQYQGLGRF